uniref:N-acetyltransferase domain-containing protein n=1 Tax=Monopterus albus TaxID=43700 RepID=A0A3Q3QPC2_MONAL|nr:probable N-acetyltransferase camello [Monopterus albus]
MHNQSSIEELTCLDKLRIQVGWTYRGEKYKGEAKRNRSHVEVHFLSSWSLSNFLLVMQLVIRRYHHSDKDAVLTLFGSCAWEFVHPCFHNAMTSPLYVTITLALCVAGYLLGSVLGAVTLQGIWVGLVYYCCYEAFISFTRERLRTDMQDIPGNYLSRPDDCFWVAEAEVDGRAQIMGIVAVVAQQSETERYGTLLRMVVSPLCRRMGVGFRLAQTVIDFSKERGFSKVMLETTSPQIAAVALYKKLGFRHVLSYSPFGVFKLARVIIFRMEKHL